MSSESSTLTTLDDATVELAAGGDIGKGGISGSPASTEADAAQTSASASSRLFIVGLPPFSVDDQPDSIEPIPSDTESLFVQFWEYHCSGESHKALDSCDRLLEVIDPADFLSHVRQANARATALRTLGRFRESRAVHLSARPFLAAADERVAGDHHHGLGLSLKWLGEYSRAFAELAEALRLYRQIGESWRVTRASVNISRLYVAANRPGLAHQLLDTLEPSTDAEIARALAYEVEGNRPAARGAIARALTLLADSTDEATRTEAVQVFERIEAR
jgi:tetratricopeptide (TPR) repeat protein